MQRDHEPRRISYTEIADTLEANISGLDPQRVSKLADLRRLRKVKATQLAREEKRLQRKLGSRHERIAAVAEQRNANNLLIANLERESERAATPQPAPRQEAWIVHGYVRDAHLPKDARLIVTIHDADGDRLEAFESAETGANGYFKLVVTGLEDSKRTDDELAVGGRKRKERIVYLHVSGSSRDYRDPRPLAPAPGEVDYREIVVRSDDDPVDPTREPEEAADDDSPPSPEESRGRTLGGRIRRLVRKKRK